MMRRTDSLFARLFGVFLIAILLAHALAFAWLTHYGDHPPPPPPHLEIDAGDMLPPAPPPPPHFRIDGPLIVLGFQLLTLLVAAWYGARLLSRPIRHLAEGAEHLAEDLDCPPMIEKGPRETRLAANAFNRMQQRIRDQVQQRTRMLAAVSHDLRTPLARLKLRLEQIPDEPLRERMDQDLGEMIEMLDATLRYLRQQRSNEAPQRLDVQAMVEAMAEDALENDARVSVQGQCRPLLAQPLSLRSCVSNLLENALRYAGHAEIELRDSDDAVEVRIIDHGPGIEESQREAVFEAFFRLDASRNRSFGGVGLGLTIAREAARRQGGDITLADTPGGGLTAILRLPRQPGINDDTKPK
ncbi:HAMP domain-containing protein [Pseudomonas sp. ABC1]|uniref:HAMP domain-containing sensor histidine kinase n=1 Tax=Pseudomonas sp. ABC1 TaxID=2748080 RepID=UPI0015C324D4|nr:ATP-binding protein [Pseudomonas sp. ABC1]QLF95050.1 HAMP domain-containing protein [Pseudomonas sp. ABC1]